MSIEAVLIVLALVAADPAPPATTNSSTPTHPAWTEAGEIATVVRAHISIAKQAGTMSRKEVGDYGEDGINLVAQYSTSDGQIFGTIFLYQPSLVDSGLTFLATDEAIRRGMGANVQVLSDQAVPIAGVPNAGRRVIYADSETGLRSGLIIVQAGDWLLKYRVSGPVSRANEIAGNLDALVSGTKFGKGNEPLPTHTIQISPCLERSPVADAQSIKPKSESAIALALFAMPSFFDDHGKPVADPTGRVPDRLCLAESSSDDKIPLLTYRTVENGSGIFSPKLFQLYGDAGIIVELTRTTKSSNELFALRHGLGRVLMYGAFPDEPSANQLRLIRHQSDQLPIVAAIKDKPDGKGTDVELDCNQFAEGCAKEK